MQKTSNNQVHQRKTCNTFAALPVPNCPGPGQYHLNYLFGLLFVSLCTLSFPCALYNPPFLVFPWSTVFLTVTIATYVDLALVGCCSLCGIRDNQVTHRYTWLDEGCAQLCFKWTPEILYTKKHFANSEMHTHTHTFVFITKVFIFTYSISLLP